MILRNNLQFRSFAWLPNGDSKRSTVKNCNCAPGCPCDFWANPTYYKCEGMMAFHILEGNFGPTKLGGIIAGGTYYWPGPLHLGNGTFQPYVSDNASAEQREAY